MGARILSTLLLWALTGAVIWFGKSLGWTLLIAILSAGAISEACALVENLGGKPMRKSAQAANVLIFGAVFCGTHFGFAPHFAGALMFATVVSVLAASIVRNPYGDFAPKSVIPTILVILAIPFMLQWLSVIGGCFSSISPYAGVLAAIWIVAAAKFSDVGAYVIGKAFGRHKMSPDISPNKTWEGAICGVISSAVVSAAFARWGAPVLPPDFTPLVAACAGAIIGCTAIVSDLVESVLKRRADIKDSGRFIPGIGGALDLADSLLLSAPVGAVLLFAILQLPVIF